MAARERLNWGLLPHINYYGKQNRGKKRKDLKDLLRSPGLSDSRSEICQAHTGTLSNIPCTCNKRSVEKYLKPLDPETTHN